MELARLFVGLPLPEDYQRGLGELTASLKPVVPGSCSWTKPGNWHITLKFLGDVLMEAVPDICAALAGVPWKSFRFRAGGGGFFPTSERPRVMWVGTAEGGASCRDLAAALEAALQPLGFGADPRPFSTHLTVARIKSSRPGSDWKKTLGILLKTQWPEAVMDRFVLWRSYLGGEGGQADAGLPGPRYVPLGEYGASG